ncbi:MAG: hypothetical protein K2O81_00990 [Clostridia bacterium]|nr:hypothetical protein [Clostridia bacterium]
MKNKRTSLIVTICLSIAFAIAAVLCFVIPLLTQKKDAPVEVSQTIKLEYKSVDGYRAYYLVGKIRNKSGRTVTFKDDGGLKVYFSGSDDVATDWLGIENIVLGPDEEFDLSVGTYYFTSSSVSVSKVSIDINGNTYYLVGKAGGDIASILGLVFILLTVTMVIVTIASARQQKTGGKRAEALTAVCSQLGYDSTVISGNLTDKSESKKAAAKTASWIIGGIFSALFTGVGVYRVYSGTSQKQFIINRNSLYMLKDGGVSADNLLNITPADFAVDSITVKKNKVVMKSVDKKQTFTFFTNKKSALSAEQIAEYLNNIFVNNVAPNSADNVQTDDAVPPADPFTELQPDVAVTDAGADAIVEKELSDNEKAPNESADNK